MGTPATQTLSFIATVLPASLPPGAPLMVVLTYQALYLFSSPSGRSRISHSGDVVRHRIDNVVGGVISLHQGIVGFELFVTHMHAEILGDTAQLIEGGSSDCHGLSPFETLLAETSLGGDSDEFSDKTCVAKIARLHFLGDRAFLNDENSL
jgi:hypothetical protein